MVRRRRAEPGYELVVERLASGEGLRLVGPLDVATADVLGRELETQVEGTVVLDLAAAEWMDSTGLALLIRTARRLHDAGGCLVLRDARGSVRRAIDFTGVARVPGIRIEPAGADG